MCGRTPNRAQPPVDRRPIMRPRHVTLTKLPIPRSHRASPSRCISQNKGAARFTLIDNQGQACFTLLPVKVQPPSPYTPTKVPPAASYSSKNHLVTPPVCHLVTSPPVFTAKNTKVQPTAPLLN